MQMIPTPGGMNHHHDPSRRALERNALFIINPSDIDSEGPRPRKSSDAPMRIAPPNSRMTILTRYELMFRPLSLGMICRGPPPLNRAISTNPLVFRVKVCPRPALAAHGHE